MFKVNSWIKNVASKSVGKILLTLVAAGLMFGGPTYLLYVLRRAVAFPYLEILSVLFFVVGLYVFLQIHEDEKQAQT